MKKLRSTKGESLAESLISILIVALGASLLAGMIVTATTLNKRANELSAEITAEMKEVEKHTLADAAPGTVTVRLTDGDETNSFDVNIFGDSAGLSAYSKVVTP